jgi:hypothetical protein
MWNKDYFFIPYFYVFILPSIGPLDCEVVEECDNLTYLHLLDLSRSFEIRTMGEAVKYGLKSLHSIL